MTRISQELILIIKKNSPLLREGLDLSYIGIDDDDIKELADLLKDKEMLKLNLQGNNITKIGAGYLSTLNISELDISNNMLGNEGARLLLDSKTIKKMYLDQNGTTKNILENNPNKNLKMTPEINKILRGNFSVLSSSLFPSELNRTDELCNKNLYSISNNTIEAKQSITKSVNNDTENKVSELFKEIESKFHISELSPEELNFFKKIVANLDSKQQSILPLNNI